MLPIQHVGGTQFYQTREAHPLAAGLIFAVLEPFIGYGVNMCGYSALTISSSPPLADMTTWGMLALGTDGTTDRFHDYTHSDTSVFTVGAFVRVDDTSVIRDAVARGNYGGANNTWALGITSGGGSRFAMRTGSTNFSSSHISLTARRWHFLAGVYDGNALRTFVDTNSGSPATVTTAYSPTVSTMRLGMRGAAGTTRWSGGIGAVFQWNRALSDAELAQAAQDVYCTWLTGGEPPGWGWSGGLASPSGLFQCQVMSSSSLSYNADIRGAALFPMELSSASALSYESVIQGAALMSANLQSASANSSPSTMYGSALFQAVLSLASALSHASSMQGSASGQLYGQVMPASSSLWEAYLTGGAYGLLFAQLLTASALSPDGTLYGGAQWAAELMTANGISIEAVISGSAGDAKLFAEKADAFAQHLVAELRTAFWTAASAKWLDDTVRSRFTQDDINRSGGRG